MRRLLTASFILLSLLLRGQDLSIAEYYIDTDPGYGNGTPITLSGSNSFIDEIIINNLSIGLHSFALRVKDNTDVWGLEQSFTFFVRESVEIQGNTLINNSEYFINHDPGYGSATSLPLSLGDTLFISELITEELTLGLNTLSLRVQDENGVWGLEELVRFIVRADQSIIGTNDMLSGFEFFIDGDPGVGSGEYVDIENADSLIFEEWISSQDLTDGNHQFSIRMKSDLGVWSLSDWVEFEFLNCDGEAIIVSGEEEICTGETVQLSLPNSYDAWYWNTHEYSNTIEVSQGGSYYGNAYDSLLNTCYLSDTLILLMFTQPNASFNLTSSFNSVNVSANGNGNDNGQNLFWQLNEEFSSTEESFSYDFLSDGWQSICLEASNVCGVDEFCDTLLLCANYEIPPYFYMDNDGDGYGDALDSIRACSTPVGFADNALDCDDSDDSIYPGAPEIPDDDIDQDCNGADLVTGINELSNSYSFYPNPANEKVFIEFIDEFSGNLTLFDVSGKTIISRSIENEEKFILRVDNLLPGLYFIQLTTNELHSIKPLVIQ